MGSIEARGLRKTYGATTALSGLDLNVNQGAILGLIGPAGAGKSTALHAILGLIECEGELRVLGRNPWSERDRLAPEVACLADVALLPRRLPVTQAVEALAVIDRRLDSAKAMRLLARTPVRPTTRVRELSKELLAQLQLALVLSIDARLLVLDEPAHGLDAAAAKDLCATLRGDGRRTVVVTAEQAIDIEDAVTDFVFLDHGRIDAAVRHGAAA